MYTKKQLFFNIFTIYVIISLVIFMKKKIFIGIFGLFLLFLLLLPLNNNKENNETKPNETLIYLNNLLEIPHYTIERRYNNDPYEGYFYTKDYVDFNNMDNQVKIYLAIRNMKQNDWKNYTKDEYITIKQTEVKRQMKEIFGNDKYTNESIFGDPCSYANFEYDDYSKIYIMQGNTCPNEYNSYYITKIIDYEIKDEEITIYEKVGYLNNNELYKIKNDSRIITTLKDNNIDKYLDELNTYKYLFIKENDKFIFKSITRM